jgi:hypothetical protein
MADESASMIALMMEAAGTSKMPVNFYQTTWHNNPQPQISLITLSSMKVSLKGNCA